MFVARLRHFAPLLLIFSRVSARDESLFTSSVTYCSEPDALLIQQFDVAYFQKNSSIWFNISAASVQPNVSVSANVMLNVYGMHPVNFTLDLCSLFNGALCPLPTYNFTGSDSIPLPSSLGVNDKIPGIAFKIPDLEAYAQLSLTEITTGELKACVQATLSNGWSAHQVAVEWATGALGLLAVVSAIWYSLSPEALAPYRLFDLFYLFQWAASTALLNLNYSLVYLAFATNFSWAMGLFPASSTSPIQLSINNMRHLTGGNMADATSGSAVALVNRKLSPYNAATASFVDAGYQMASSATGSRVFLHNLTSANFVSPAFVDSVEELSTASTVQLVTATSGNVLQAGVPIYVNYVGIATANAFMTIFLVVLMLLAILMATLAIGYSGVALASRCKQRKYSRFLQWGDQYLAFAGAWLLRVFLVAATPITTFALYQWTLKDSWLSILLSVVLFLGLFCYLLYSSFLTVRLAIHSTPYAWYTQPGHLSFHGPLFALYRSERCYASIPLLIAIFFKAIFTAFAQANGEVQVICILVIECAILACLLFLRPHKTRRGDVLATYLAITRVTCTGLLVAFLESLNLAAIPRVAIGIVIAVIISVAVIVMFINTLVNLGLMKLLPARFQRRPTPSTNTSVLEKGGIAEGIAGRPRNPTPDRNIPLDPTINQPYPESPSRMTAEDHSTYSEESGSTTLGSLLPRRWSFQPSQPLSHSRTNSQSQYSPTNASSPRQSHPPSPLHPHSQSHSRQPTIDEHSSMVF
ncbi:TRP-domain-containing protein [Gyrodon lividus]|nr:TRP-domain-containing protein [Gyrodon lividus]